MENIIEQIEDSRRINEQHPEMGIPEPPYDALRREFYTNMIKILYQKGVIEK